MKKSKIDCCVSAVVISVCLIKAVLYGGSKPPSSTNEPPDDASSPTNVPMLCAGPLRGRGLSQTSQVGQTNAASGGLGNPAAPVMFEVISNWTARGAYCDWERIEFRNGFAFPVGTNFIDSVMLMAYGEIKSNLHCSRRPSAISLRSIATSDFDFSLPSRVSLEPGVSSVTHGLTPSNSYLFAWTNCCVERSATNRVDASIELFRNGAVAITTTSTNQPPTIIYQPPTPPEGFIGNGQDADWIRATFPDEATNILAKGYANWLLNDYVGINEQNGHYLAEVTIAALPEDGSPCYLVCGPYKVHVTQPGTYGFPLEVCEVYEARTYPAAVPMTMSYDDGYRGEGVSHEIVDLTPSPRLLMSLAAPSPSKTWFKWKDLPRVIVTPARIAYEDAVDTILEIWTNLGNTNEVTITFGDVVDRALLIINHNEAKIVQSIEADKYAVMAYCHAKRAEGTFEVSDRIRYDAGIYNGEMIHHGSDTNGIYEVLTVQTVSGSMDAQHGTMTVTVPGGQSALVSVLFASQEPLMPDRFKYDDSVSWSVTCGADTVTAGSASVWGMSASNDIEEFPDGMLTSASCLSCVCVDAPEGQPVTLTLAGTANNARDGLRQSCVRIVVESWDANAAE